MDNSYGQITQQSILQQYAINAQNTPISHYLQDKPTFVNDQSGYNWIIPQFVKLLNQTDNDQEMVINISWLNFWFSTLYPLSAYILYSNVPNQMTQNGYIQVNSLTNESTLPNLCLKSDNFNIQKYVQNANLDTQNQQLGYRTQTQDDARYVLQANLISTIQANNLVFDLNKTIQYNSGTIGQSWNISSLELPSIAKIIYNLQLDYYNKTQSDARYTLQSNLISTIQANNLVFDLNKTIQYNSGTIGQSWNISSLEVPSIAKIIYNLQLDYYNKTQIDSTFQKISNLNSDIQSLGYLTLSQNSSVFMKISGQANLNMNSLYYITNYKNLIDYTTTYDNYCTNNYDVKNQIAINNGNFTPTSSLVSYMDGQNYIRTNSVNPYTFSNSACKLKYNSSRVISNTADNTLVDNTWVLAQGYSSGSGVPISNNQYVVGNLSGTNTYNLTMNTSFPAQMYIQNVTDSNRKFICFTGNQTYLKRINQVLQPIYLSNYQGLTQQSPGSYIQLEEDNQQTWCFNLYNNVDAFQFQIQYINPISKTVYSKNQIIGSSGVDSVVINGTQTNNASVTFYGQTFQVASFPAINTFAQSYGNWISRSYSSTGINIQQHLFKFSLSPNGSGTTYDVIQFDQNDNGVTRQAYIVNSVIQYTVSSKFFKKNVLYHDQENDARLYDFFMRMHTCKYQSKSKCCRCEIQPCNKCINENDDNSIKHNFIIEDLSPEDLQYAKENNFVYEQICQDQKDISRSFSRYLAPKENYIAPLIFICQTQDKAIKDMQKYQSFLQNMIIEQEQKINELEKKNNMLEMQNSMILQKLCQFEKRIGKIEEQTIFETI